MTCNSVPRLLHTCVLCVPFLMLFLISAIVVWIRQEWHILGHFELTEAMQTKRQIIHFNGSNFVLFVNRFISRGIFPPSREATFLDCSRDSVIQNQYIPPPCLLTAKQ